MLLPSLETFNSFESFCFEMSTLTQICPTVDHKTVGLIKHGNQMTFEFVKKRLDLELVSHFHQLTSFAVQITVPGVDKADHLSEGAAVHVFYNYHTIFSLH